MRKTYYNYTKI